MENRPAAVVPAGERPPGLEGPDAAVRGHVRAWVFLAGALALHVADEALTGFLAFYNPVVTELRSRWGWFPMPTFSFGPWLAGLVALVVLLLGMTPRVRDGSRGTRTACWILSVVMFANGMAHLVGSALLERWLPGSTSAPLLVGGSIVLAMRTRARRPA